MSYDLFSSLDSLAAVSAAASSLLVRDVTGEYRPAEADEVLQAAQRVLAGRVRGSDVLTSPAVVKDFLRVRLGNLPHEVFAVVHLDAQHRVLDYVEMFRGTLTQTSVYSREVVKDALSRNSSALLLVHNHPSGSSEPSRADEMLTQNLRSAAMLVRRAGARSPDRGGRFDPVDGRKGAHVGIEGFGPLCFSSHRARFARVPWLAARAAESLDPVLSGGGTRPPGAPLSAACRASAGAPPVKGRCFACGPRQRIRFLP